MPLPSSKHVCSCLGDEGLEWADSEELLRLGDVSTPEKDDDAKSIQNFLLTADHDKSSSTSEGEIQPSSKLKCASDSGKSTHLDSQTNSSSDSDEEELEISPDVNAAPGSLMVPGEEDMPWQNYLVYVMLVYCFLFIRYEV
ncbi:hypothetical protein ElyMa_001389300 [Elysia marginata]|uniref:CTNNB1 binding N-teminal domain-containing protein n=1 Tax=Elysia marginata TaxID=1093978 RepID=A0AAV4IVT8_9GAST|nr:hypothetical protein ElyMa_001389300 [Elysia marginata]